MGRRAAAGLTSRGTARSRRRSGRFFRIFIAARTVSSEITNSGADVAHTTMSAPGRITGIASMLTTRAPVRDASSSARARFLAAIVNWRTPESMKWHIESPAISPEPTRSTRLSPRFPSTFEARLTAA